MMTSTTNAAARGGHAHLALFYRDHDAYTRSIHAFLHAGFAAGQPAMVAVPGPKVDLLRAGLDGAAGRVDFADMADIGRNPASIIAHITRFLDTHPGKTVRFVGEPIWAGRTPAEIREATRHEALLNTAFADAPITILCPYDLNGLHAATLADARRTHPAVVDHNGQNASRDYTDPTLILAGDIDTPPQGVGPVKMMDYSSPTDLAKLRHLVTDHASLAGISPRRCADLTVAVNEIATNTLMHTPATGTLRIWRDTHTLVCEINDSGHITDPMTGRRAPTTEGTQPRGLWTANQLCDLVEIRSSQSGTNIRLHMRPGDPCR